MQNTANLWDLMCAELETRRKQQTAAEQSLAAKNFEKAAREAFHQHPARLRDAIEIAGDIHQSAGAMDEARRLQLGDL